MGQETTLAWCLVTCPVEAISISAVGAKVVLDDVCVGCKLCTIACPYGTMFYNPDTEKAFKCNLCDGSPACAEACPTAAIEYVETETSDWLGTFAAERGAGQLVQPHGICRNGRLRPDVCVPITRQATGGRQEKGALKDLSVEHSRSLGGGHDETAVGTRKGG